MSSVNDFNYSFRRVYPENKIRSTVLKYSDRAALIEATFPDGVFWFVVTKNSVSSSYSNKNKAMEDFENEK